MATTGKIRSLTTRPFQSSDLAFEIPGVIDWQNQNMKVGSRLAAADVVSADAMLTAFGQRSADDSRSVVYNAARIQADLSAKAFFRLRNYQETMGLGQVILQRDLQYGRIYRHSAQVAQIARA